VDTLLLTQLPLLPVRNLLQHVPLGLLHSLSVWLEVLVQHELDQVILLPHSERLLDDVPDPVLLDPLDELLLPPHFMVRLSSFHCFHVVEVFALPLSQVFQLTAVSISLLAVVL